MGALEANKIVEMWKLKQCTVYNDQERQFPRVKENRRAAVRLDPHLFLRINIRKHNNLCTILCPGAGLPASIGAPHQL